MPSSITLPGRRRLLRGRAVGNLVPLDLTPMIDCVFLLLIFFLVTSVLKKVEFEVPLNLPAAARTVQAAPVPELLVISVDALGQTFVDGTPVTNDQLGARLRPAVEAGGEAVHVRIDGDEAAPYARVIRVLDEVHALGVKQVGLKALGPQDAPAIGQPLPRKPFD